MSFSALMYHDVSDRDFEYAVSPANYREQLEFLHDEGYTVESFAQCSGRLAATEPFPRRYALLTFDDGFESFLHAAEIAQSYGFLGSFFITKQYCQQRSGFLSDNQLRELAELGDVGSHTVSHSLLTKMSAEDARRELVDSKSWLQDVLGTDVTTFAAPGGAMDRRVADMALASGYRLLGNSAEWWNDPSIVARSLTVNRTAVYRGSGVDTIAQIASRSSKFFARRRARTLASQAACSMLSQDQIRRVSRLRRSIVGGKRAA